MFIRKDKKSVPAGTRSSKSSAQNSSAPPNNYEDDFDDFDPRGTSTTSKYSEIYCKTYSFLLMSILFIIIRALCFYQTRVNVLGFVVDYFWDRCCWKL